MSILFDLNKVLCALVWLLFMQMNNRFGKGTFQLHFKLTISSRSVRWLQQTCQETAIEYIIPFISFWQLNLYEIESALDLRRRTQTARLYDYSIPCYSKWNHNTEIWELIFLFGDRKPTGNFPIPFTSSVMWKIVLSKYWLFWLPNICEWVCSCRVKFQFVHVICAANRWRSTNL